MRRISVALGNLLIVISIAGVVLVAFGGTTPAFVARLELTPMWQTAQTPTESNAAFRTAQADAPIAAPGRLAELDSPVEHYRANGPVDDHAFVELKPLTPTPVVVVPASTPTPVRPSSAPGDATSSSIENRLTPALEPAQDAEPEPVDFRPITRVILPRIALAADVVPAELVEQDDGVSWMVPAFKAGHAQYTAGPGQAGNGVLFGHVTSRSLGNVFEQLFRAHVGDLVEVFDGTERFDYRVVAVHAVSRTDVSVLLPTESASVSLITCTGLWNAALHDYMERLVVRAELSG
jgi:LPXTG-site transpeptidase (sortase) family protein